MAAVRTDSTQGTLFRWSTLSNPQRFEAYNRWSFYLLLAGAPFVALIVLTGATPWTLAEALGYTVLVFGHAVACLAVVFGAFDYILSRRSAPRRSLGLLTATTVANLAWILAVYPGVEAEDSTAMITPTVLVLLAVLVAICPLINAWRVVGASAAVAAISGGAVALTREPALVVFTVFYALLAALFLGLSLRISVWMVLVVWDMDRRRAVDARLAVAEERLRFSRDLHDVFGRTLSTVAVKSELAAALAQRDDPRGVQEMLQVRELAEDGLKEVRAVVQGYRAADLPTEMVGARSILTASGIDTRVAGEHLHLPEPVQQALAWVVREGVTNAVRHSDATECIIELSERNDGYGLQISNDGVTTAEGVAPSGSGLRGLTERLGALGGTVHVPQASPGWFVLSTWVPGNLPEALTAPTDGPDLPINDPDLPRAEQR